MGEAQGPFHVVDLNNDQWIKLFRANRLLRSWVAEGTLDSPRVERAPKEALLLDNANPFDDYEVRDDSVITTQTTTSRVAFNLMINGFSENGVHAAFAAGAQGLTGGFKTDVTWAQETTTGETTGAEVTAIHFSYTFPRVEVELKESALKMSPACKTFLDDRKGQEPTEEDLKAFFHDFGGLLARTVWLGGRLYSSARSTSSSAEDLQKIQKSLEVGVSATFTAPFVGLEAGGSHSKGQGRVVEIKGSGETSKLSIYAQGGSAFLAESSLEWAKSLAPYQTWRQEHLEDLLPFLLKVVDRAGPEEADSKKYLEGLEKLRQTRIILEEQKTPDAPPSPQVVNLKMEWGVRWRFIGSRLHFNMKRYDWYQWTLYVQPSSPEDAKFLDQIKVLMDPVWYPKTPELEKKGAYFECSTAGFGSVRTTITFVLEAGWKFQRDGGPRSSKQEVPYALAWPVERQSFGQSTVTSQTYQIVMG